MTQVRRSGAGQWVHAVISVVAGAAAVLMLAVNWFDATTAGAVAGAVAIVGLVREAQHGDVSRRRNLHLVGLLLGVGSAALAQMLPGLMGFLLM